MGLSGSLQHSIRGKRGAPSRCSRYSRCSLFEVFEVLVLGSVVRVPGCDESRLGGNGSISWKRSSETGKGSGEDREGQYRRRIGFSNKCNCLPRQCAAPVPTPFFMTCHAGRPTDAWNLKHSQTRIMGRKPAICQGGARWPHPRGERRERCLVCLAAMAAGKTRREDEMKGDCQGSEKSPNPGRFFCELLKGDGRKARRLNLNLSRRIPDRA